MSEYTPTTEEVRSACSRYLNVEDFERWLAARDAEVQAAVAEESEGEHVVIVRYGMYHAKFEGIGGDVTSLGLTREAWKAMGEPDVLAVSWVPVEQGGAEA